MKNNLKVKSLMTIIIIAIMLTISTIANASTGDSVGMSLTSSSKLKAGDTVTVNVNLTSINAGNGIDTITAELAYDTSVFETLSSSSFTASNDWTPSYASSTNMLTVLKNSKVKSPETVMTITLKVKDTISVNSTTITLKNIVVSGGREVDGGTGDIYVNNALVTISKAEEASSSTEKPANNTINNPGTSNTAKQNNVSKDSTTTKTSTLPKTGLEQYGTIAIVVVAIIGIFSYVVYKKIEKYVK